jgi:hypothetical protein
VPITELRGAAGLGRRCPRDRFPHDSTDILHAFVFTATIDRKHHMMANAAKRQSRESFNYTTTKWLSSGYRKPQLLTVAPAAPFTFGSGGASTIAISPRSIRPLLVWGVAAIVLSPVVVLSKSPALVFRTKRSELRSIVARAAPFGIGGKVFRSSAMSMRSILALVIGRVTGVGSGLGLAVAASRGPVRRFRLERDHGSGECIDISSDGHQPVGNDEQVATVLLLLLIEQAELLLLFSVLPQ